MAQCTAKSKRSGEQCGKDAMVGREKCHIHGGKTPQGISLPQTIHGRYSRDLPTRLQANYERAVSDAQLLVLRDEIGLLEARLGELIGRIDTGEAGAVWKALKMALEEYRTAKAIGSSIEVTKALLGIENLIDQGIEDYLIWGEIQSLIQQRRKVVESERKRLVEMQQMITSERAMVLLAAVVDTVRKHVSDRDTLQAISSDIRALVAA